MNNNKIKRLQLRTALTNKLSQLPAGTQFSCSAGVLNAMGIQASKGDAISLGRAIHANPATFHLKEDYDYPGLVYENKTADNQRHYVITHLVGTCKTANS